MNGPTLNQMHLDAFPISGVGDSVGAFVLGVQFGPMLLAVTDSVEEAFDEWDERHGRRVDFDADASDLADYDGDTIQEQTESAMDAGDIRVNDSGTMVWVDHYEWCREFATVREAGKFWRAWAERNGYRAVAEHLAGITLAQVIAEHQPQTTAAEGEGAAR